MHSTTPIIIFFLDNQRYALRLSAVERVVRVVEITPLPKSPPIVLGVINVHGSVIAVLDIRQRFGLPSLELSLSDNLIIAHCKGDRMALVVDCVQGVVEVPSRSISVGSEFSSHAEYVEGVVSLPDGLVLIHDLETFLSAEEEHRLEEAMRA